MSDSSNEISLERGSFTIFPWLFNELSKAGVIKEYEYWKGHVIVSIDGVEHFSSTKVHCDHCTTRAHRNGETSYHHAGLGAVLLHPDREEVFTLDFEVQSFPTMDPLYRQIAELYDIQFC